MKGCAGDRCSRRAKFSAGLRLDGSASYDAEKGGDSIFTLTPRMLQGLTPSRIVSPVVLLSLFSLNFTPTFQWLHFFQVPSHASEDFTLLLGALELGGVTLI